jgi:glycosyltransferase involved in cell wall biosynthesis
MSVTLISIIIPAHNEEAVIGRCVRAVTDGAGAGEIDVIVVCNGCTDHTAEVARDLGQYVRVIETNVASKVYALNLGDEAATGFPRVYVDADVVLPLEALRKMAMRLEEGDMLAVSPLVRLNLADCSWAVRAFYLIDRRLPSAGETIGGSGVYAISEAGRKRFERFPRVTGDDAFIRRTFKPHERCVVEGCYSTVTPPKKLRGVIAIKTRSHFGNYELARLYPHLTANVGASNRPVLVKLALRPWLWPELAVYGYVKVVARLRAMRQLRAGIAMWERDASSRLVKTAP